MDRDLAVLLQEHDAAEAARESGDVDGGPVAPRGPVPADGMLPPVGWVG